MNEIIAGRKIFRLALFIAGAGLIIWVVLGNVPPNGRLRVTSGAGEASAFIGILRPEGRVTLVPRDAGGHYDVSAEPAYFQMRAPRAFRSAKVTVEYQEEGQPLLELGGRTDLEAWTFDLKPLEAPMLERLGWSARQEGKYRIYEKKASQRQAEDILATGDPRRVGVYKIDPVRWQYVPSPGAAPKREDREPKAGSSKTYLYAGGEPIDVSLMFKDNAPGRGVPVVVRLIRRGATLLRRELSGDGLVEMVLTGAEKGIYRLEVEADADVTLESVKTKNRVLGAHEPEFHTLTWESSLERLGIDTVVADYRPPAETADGWKAAEAEFDLGILAKDRRREIQMALSAPGLAHGKGLVRVRRISVEYLGEPWNVLIRRLWTYFAK
jgi:hypothetical protein